MYFIEDPTRVNKKYYKEDQYGRLIPTNTAYLFESYEAARNAIRRTRTVCKKLIKLHPSGIYVQQSRLTTNFKKEEWRRNEAHRYQMHKVVIKNDFYNIRFGSLKIVRVETSTPLIKKILADYGIGISSTSDPIYGSSGKSSIQIPPSPFISPVEENNYGRPDYFYFLWRKIKNWWLNIGVCHLDD